MLVFTAPRIKCLGVDGWDFPGRALWNFFPLTMTAVVSYQSIMQDLSLGGLSGGFVVVLFLATLDCILLKAVNLYSIIPVFSSNLLHLFSSLSFSGNYASTLSP